jgi:two-component sensor histidine kinase
MSHRVKNSLTSMVGLLRVQARSAQSQDVKSALKDASLRVTTIAEVHDHLWRSSHVGFIELANFMTELCKKLSGNIGKHTLSCRSDAYALLLAADHAVPLGLLINELVADAIKCAYPDGRGAIEVSAREIDGSLHVEVSDQGKGLPQGFDIDEPRASLGFKVITGMVRQLRGHLTVDNDRKGSRFLLELPNFALGSIAFGLPCATRSNGQPRLGFSSWTISIAKHRSERQRLTSGDLLDPFWWWTGDRLRTERGPPLFIVHVGETYLFAPPAALKPRLADAATELMVLTVPTFQIASSAKSG